MDKINEILSEDLMRNASPEDFVCAGNVMKSDPDHDPIGGCRNEWLIMYDLVALVRGNLASAVNK